MAHFNVTIRNISANVDGMKIAVGESSKFEVKASDFAEAIQKAVKRAFGSEAIFTNNSGYGEVGFSNGEGTDLYGRIYTEYDKVHKA